MLAYFLYGLFFISCLFLIAAVLLQPGKSDAGALFTSNISSTAFGPRGTQSVLSKITIIVAALFMVSALLLSMPAITGNVSVLQTTSPNTNETKPAAATDSNTANTNVTSNTENSNVTTNSANANVANQPGNTAPSNNKTENKASNTKANK